MTSDEPLGKVVAFPLKLSEADAFRIIREAAEIDSGTIFLSDHAKDRMRQRDISRSQIISVLRSTSSTMSEGPYRTARGDFKCQLEGYAAGDAVNVVVAIRIPLNAQSVLVITVMN